MGQHKVVLCHDRFIISNLFVLAKRAVFVLGTWSNSEVLPTFICSLLIGIVANWLLFRVRYYVVSKFVFRQRKRSGPSLEWKLEQRISLKIQLWAGALDILFRWGLFDIIFCCLGNVIHYFSSVEVRRWWYVPAFNDKLPLIILDALNVSLHAYPFHVVGKVKLICFFFLRILALFSSVRRPLDL